VVGNDLDIGTVWLDSSFFLEFFVFISGQLSETVSLTDDDLLFSGELEFTSSKSFNSVFNISFGNSARVQDLVDFNSCDFTLGLTEGTSHTSLKSISTGA